MCNNCLFFKIYEIKDIAEFFLVDTVPFVQKYWNESKFDWRQVAPRDTYLSTLLTVSYWVN